MCVGGPPKPMQPIRPHSRATRARLGLPGAFARIAERAVEEGPRAQAP